MTTQLEPFCLWRLIRRDTWKFLASTAVPVLASPSLKRIKVFNVSTMIQRTYLLSTQILKQYLAIRPKLRNSFLHCDYALSISHMSSYFFREFLFQSHLPFSLIKSMIVICIKVKARNTFCLDMSTFSINCLLTLIHILKSEKKQSF